MGTPAGLRRNDHPSVRVTIRVPGISRERVKAIAMPFESVRRCERTGETLLGGNTYVFVGLASELTDKLEREIARWAETLPQNGLALAPSADLPTVLVWRSGRYDFFVSPTESDSHICTPCMGSNTVGAFLAQILIERGVEGVEFPVVPAQVDAPAEPFHGTLEVEVLPELAPQVEEEKPLHLRDEDCSLDETDQCTVCGVDHGDPCLDCGGRGFHRLGCLGADLTVQALQSLVGQPVLYQDELRGGVQEGTILRITTEGVFVEPPGRFTSAEWRRWDDLEPAFQVRDLPAPGDPVVLVPFAGEDGDPVPTPGWVIGLHGFFLEIATPDGASYRRLPQSVVLVAQQDPCMECSGWGWVPDREALDVHACDRCGRFLDDMARAAAQSYANSRGVTVASLIHV